MYARAVAARERAGRRLLALGHPHLSLVLAKMHCYHTPAACATRPHLKLCTHQTEGNSWVIATVHSVLGQA